MKQFKKNNLTALFLFGFIFLLTIFTIVGPAAAKESNWVKDDAHVLSENTISQIDSLNNDDLSKVKGHPQYAVITLNGIPTGQGSIEDYAHDQYKKLGLGQKGWNNGILLIIDTKNHVNRLETGTGMEAVLPDGAKSQIISTEIQQAFKQQDYNTGVAKLSTQLVSYLGKHQNQIDAPSNRSTNEDNNNSQIRQDSPAAILQKNSGLIGFLIFDVLLVVALGSIFYWLIYPKFRLKAQISETKKRLAKTDWANAEVSAAELQETVLKQIDNEVENDRHFRVQSLTYNQWWYLLNASQLQQPLDLKQAVAIEMKKGNPLYDSRLISKTELLGYQQMLEQRKAQNQTTVKTEILQNAKRKQYPGNLTDLVNHTTRIAEIQNWFGLPSTDSQFQTGLQSLIELDYADQLLRYQIHHDANLQADLQDRGINDPDSYVDRLSDDEKKKIARDGVINTALLITALGVLGAFNSHSFDDHDDFFPPSGGFGGGSDFDDGGFGSDFGGSGSDDGGGFNF
ncbi:TPM domain-containing protein [Fructilactobacillus vespulae]|uniref:TPM domain-containing protein n=1 Tax=Fructilactobacillus vespulae TaxID=1249630 RepID=UPI0039B3D6B2